MPGITELLIALADWLPLGYAFGAGIMATVNPCGFLLLPSYVAYYLGAEEKDEGQAFTPVLALQGLVLALAITVGFVVLFLVIGVAVSVGGRALLRMVPASGLVIGMALVGLGLWLLFRGGSMGIVAASRIRAPLGRNVGAAFVFGVAYGVASLSCTLPVFLVVVGSALATADIALALLQFVSYGLGMGFVIAIIIASTAFFKGAMYKYLRRVSRYVPQIAAVFLIGAGGYLIYYWMKYGPLT
jgi:cytochrome c biogenesis protein CcdA